ncbi:MAG: NAD(P)/FAD-dependent oxidoreductase [Candidatus Aenigmatarchaeota archaeon]
MIKIDKEVDVIIVGCGPAGAWCAKRLAESGVNVIVLDRNEEIGTPVRCGEGFSKTIEERLNLKLPSFCIAQKIDGAFIYAPNGKFVEVKGFGYVLERKMFDKWLAIEASNAGAKILAKSYVYDLIKEKGKITGIKANIVGEDMEIKGKIIVGADGVESMIAKKAGINTTCSPFLVDSGFEYELANIKLRDEKKLEIFLGSEVAPRGYVWIFPKGKNRANVGVGIVGSNEKGARYYLDKFIASREELRKGSIIEVKGGAIPVGGFLRDMVKENVLLVGDAAHQVNPIHGGGIGEAMTASEIAAKVIKKALDKNDLKILKEYNTLWYKSRGNTLKKIEKLREIVEKLSDDQLNKLAEALEGEDIYDITHGNYLKLVKTLLKLGFKLAGF